MDFSARTRLEEGSFYPISRSRIQSPGALLWTLSDPSLLWVRQGHSDP